MKRTQINTTPLIANYNILTEGSIWCITNAFQGLKHIILKTEDIDLRQAKNLISKYNLVVVHRSDNGVIYDTKNKDFLKITQNGNTTKTKTSDLDRN